MFKRTYTSVYISPFDSLYSWFEHSHQWRLLTLSTTLRPYFLPESKKIE